MASKVKIFVCFNTNNLSNLDAMGTIQKDVETKVSPVGLISINIKD